MKKSAKEIEGIPIESLTVLKPGPEDVLVIKANAMLSQEFIREKEAEFSEKLGCKVAIFDVCFDLKEGLKHGEKADGPDTKGKKTDAENS